MELGSKNRESGRVAGRVSQTYCRSSPRPVSARRCEECANPSEAGVNLYLVRHAEAVDLGGEVATDFDRPLTPHGISQAEKLAAALQKAGAVPEVVATSPLVRAVQTAERLAAVLTPGKEPYVLDRLALDQLKPRKLSQDAAALGESVLLVGHMPDIAAYAGWLLGTGTGVIDFPKAAAAGFEIADGAKWKGGGRLLWLVPPAFVG
jgi:phosphohistidine phosphatase